MRRLLDIALLVAAWGACIFFMGITMRIMVDIFILGWNTIP